MKFLSIVLIALFAVNGASTTQSDPTGEWIGTFTSPKVTGKIILNIKKDDKGSLTGEIIVHPPERQAHPSIKFSNIEFNGTNLKIRFSIPDKPERAEITATITGNEMKGSYSHFVNEVEGETGSIKATRK